jgi:hypothetical protein
MYPVENPENGNVTKKLISRLLVAEQAEMWQPGEMKGGIAQTPSSLNRGYWLCAAASAASFSRTRIAAGRALMRAM